MGSALPGPSGVVVDRARGWEDSTAAEQLELTEDALRCGAEKTTLLPAETSKAHTLSTAAHFCS